MSASLHAIDGDVSGDPRRHEKRLRCAYDNAMREHGLSGSLAFGDYPEFLERRVRTLERTVRTILASDTLTDLQRAKVIAVMYGAPGSTLDSRMLSDLEFKMIAEYRRMDNAGRQMLRTLFERLASTTPEATG